MAKRHQAQMIISDSFLEGFIKMLRNYARTPLYRIYLPFFLLGLWQAITRRREWVPLISWTVSYFITYIALGVSRYFWYYAPLTPAMVVLSGIGLVDFVHFLEKYLRGYASALLVLILLLLVAPEIRSLLYLYQHPDPRLPMSSLGKSESAP
jgi:phosphoglycerol transferase MdoB-like AlkP superfamily enzyme